MIRNIQSYILATELAPFRVQILVATCLLGFDVLVFPASSIYFKFINDDWRYIGYYAVVFTSLVTLGSMILPESPRFLYDKGDFNEARAIINNMAKTNKVKNFNSNWTFDAEGDPQIDSADGKLGKYFDLPLLKTTHKL